MHSEPFWTLLIVLLLLVFLVLAIRTNRTKKREEHRRAELRQQQRQRQTAQLPPFQNSNPGTYRPRDDYYGPAADSNKGDDAGSF